MKTMVIIQARLGSSRFPGKVLREIVGKPMLWHIVDRLKHVPSIAEIVVAVPDGAKDEPLRRFCSEQGILFWAGSEHDVLDRYYQVARMYQGDPILRITADCPLVDPVLIEDLIDLYQGGEYDHVGVATGAGAERLTEGRFPDGFDGECFSFAALERAWREATDTRDREHVTRYMWSNRHLFRCSDLKSKQPYRQLRLTVDHPDDLRLVTKIYESLYNPERPFLLADVMAFLEKNDHLFEINRRVSENVGYREILNDDYHRRQ
jgi:spore coat polysaccharide biosynthesis protein SpsF